MRYNEERGVYRDCRWCGGRGCLQCPGEADREYKRLYPNGPQPVARMALTDETSTADLANFFGSVGVLTDGFAEQLRQMLASAKAGRDAQKVGE